jgi:hypothetical protein
VRVNNIDFKLRQHGNETTNLQSHVQILEIGQREFWDITKTKPLNLDKQYPVQTQAGDVNLVISSFMEETGELHCLTLGATLMKTVD